MFSGRSKRCPVLHGGFGEKLGKRYEICDLKERFRMTQIAEEELHNFTSIYLGSYKYQNTVSLINLNKEQDQK